MAMDEIRAESNPRCCDDKGCEPDCDSGGVGNGCVDGNLGGLLSRGWDERIGIVIPIRLSTPD